MILVQQNESLTSKAAKSRAAPPFVSMQKLAGSEPRVGSSSMAIARDFQLNHSVWSLRCLRCLLSLAILLLLLLRTFMYSALSMKMNEGTSSTQLLDC